MLELDEIKALDLLKKHQNYNSFINNNEIDSYTVSIQIRYPNQATLFLKKKVNTTSNEEIN
jgi:hypothetical protein